MNSTRGQLMLVLFGVTYLLTCIVQGCKNGWFGAKCQYMCHCKEGVACGTDGECQGGQCKKGFFGPACQYYDVAYTSLSIGEAVLAGMTGVEPYFRDGDDSTCRPVEHKNNLNHKLKLHFNHSIWFTWLRLVVDAPEHPEYTVYGTLGETVPKVIKPFETLVRSAKMSETYGEFEHAIDALYFAFKKNRVKVCSVYVSGGRNVALKQPVEQSTTLRQNNVTWSVDGDQETRFCSYTFIEHGKPLPEEPPYWALTFSRGMAVHAYTLINRDSGDNMCGIRLQAWNKDELVQLYYDKDQYHMPTQRALFEMRFLKASEVTKVNVSFQEDNWITGFSPCVPTRAVNKSKFLTICELMAFGDSICPPGYWGFDCEKTCKCDMKKDVCLVSSGDGCHAQDCKEGTWGFGCTETCPEGCKHRMCNVDNGKCVNCSGLYYDPDGDLSCSKKCNENCGGEKTCHISTGNCLEGCEKDFVAPKCIEEEGVLTVKVAESTATVLIVVIVLIAVAIVAAAVAGVLYKTGKCPSRKDKGADAVVEGEKLEPDLQSELESRLDSQLDDEVGQSESVSAFESSYGTSAYSSSEMGTKL